MTDSACDGNNPGGVESSTMRTLLLPFAVLVSVIIGCSTAPGTLIGGDKPKEIAFPQKRVESYGEHVVTVEGHWRQTKWAGMTGIPAVNAVNIYCNKLEGVCTEIRADLYTRLDKDFSPPPQLLVRTPQAFRILSWLDGSVVARDEAPVADIDLRISTKDGVVEKNYRETKARGSNTADPSIWRVYVLE